MTAQHPDFQAELERLAYTQNYMQQILNESQRDLQSAQENIRKSMADLDYLDSSLSYLNILTNARFFEMARNQKEGLEAVQKKPYFARIHFQKTGDPEEFLYIGKTSLFHRETHEPIIVDWRSPVANVYYDGTVLVIWNMMFAEKFIKDIYLPNDNIKLKMAYCSIFGILT